MKTLVPYPLATTRRGVLYYSSAFYKWLVLQWADYVKILGGKRIWLILTILSHLGNIGINKYIIYMYTWYIVYYGIIIIMAYDLCRLYTHYVLSMFILKVKTMYNLTQLYNLLKYYELTYLIARSLPNYYGVISSEQTLLRVIEHKSRLLD